jgi:hypothetical protein
LVAYGAGLAIADFGLAAAGLVALAFGLAVAAGAGVPELFSEVCISEWMCLWPPLLWWDFLCFFETWCLWWFYSSRLVF